MVKKSKKCTLKITTPEGKELRGTAAQLHYISSCGGWDQYIRSTYHSIAHSVAEKLATQAIEQQKQNVEPIPHIDPSYTTVFERKKHVH